MQLNPEEVRRFYVLWQPLILFVNRRLRLVPSMLRPGSDDLWNPNEVRKVRDAMWANDSLREAFIAENPAALFPEDLAIIDSWKDRKAGKFFLVKQLKKYTVLVGDDSAVYGVLGLTNPLSEVVPFIPCIADAVLLSFAGRIIYDSLIVPFNIMLGPGVRRSLEQTYRDAKERGAIITSLPPEGPADPERERETAQSTEAKVLDAFRKHLLRSGLSLKVAERDAASVAAFAETYLLQQTHPRLLRDFGLDDVRGFVAHVKAAGEQRKETLLGLKRFLRLARYGTDGLSRR